MADQFHFDPATYLDMVRAEVPDYELLQSIVADAAGEVDARTVLDLGTGTGETMHRVQSRLPAARLTGVDESEAMLAVAHELIPRADLRVARLQDELPEGPFDLVVSALAIHHLDADEKADLFRRVDHRLTGGGRFVLADVVVPDDPADAITPLDDGYDQPSRADEQLQWLRDSGFDAQLRWQNRDLAVIVADRRKD
ncbi:MAG TPA: class I SAM-dependent methyltransferase [Acidimicrobiia bacterium]|nr:class I SAM-dependent methyltransferase [Acidimicrobiia bacterium]